ncbi:hypothetical protein Busp01_25860 [Trinickia caryophylli]|nr:hypothetical protein Busp01_25860 [Trinickia caryophylli]
MVVCVEPPPQNESLAERLDSSKERQEDEQDDAGALHARFKQGKGKKDRMIPIDGRALAWVARYRDEVRPELAIAGDDGTLFLTVTGQAFSDNRMTQMVRNCVRAAGLGNIGSSATCSGTRWPRRCWRTGRRAVHPGDAGARGRQDDAGLHAGEHPGAEGYPFGYTSGAAWPYGVEDR